MSSPPSTARLSRLERLGRPGQWLLLGAGSLALGLGLAATGLPAALLLGPMLAAIAFGASGHRIGVPGAAIGFAQGVIGCMIARSLPLSIAGNVLARWPLFLVGVFSVVGASALLGWAMTRARVLPGTTVVWGLSPGAASAMTLLAASHGADVQLVALMQYVRVMFVVCTASLVTHLLGSAPAAQAAAPAVWAVPAWPALAATLALAAGGPWLAWRLRSPSGALIIPIVVGVVGVHTGWLQIELPRPLLALAYAIVGWRIGLGFTRPLLVHAARSLPAIVGAAAALIGVCALLALLLAVAAGLDPLTAYLAMSPGGLDSVAIIAATNPIDLSFVLTMQLLRFVVVLFAGPPLAKGVAARSKPTAGESR